MITLFQDGCYTLLETKAHTKILTLDDKSVFAWINGSDAGEILVTYHKNHAVDHILAMGKYRLYEAKDESDFTGCMHLELSVGNGMWQGYLLPSGLPLLDKKRECIIPTNEIITKSVFKSLFKRVHFQGLSN